MTIHISGGLLSSACGSTDCLAPQRGIWLVSKNSGSILGAANKTDKTLCYWDILRMEAPVCVLCVLLAQILTSRRQSLSRRCSLFVFWDNQTGT